MTDLFFYGTLRDARLLEIVLGRTAAAQPAQLPDHAVVEALGQSFPLLIARDNATADGILVRDLSDDDIARLDFYEGAFDYALVSVTVDTDDGAADALVYMPPVGRWPEGEAWSLDAWQDRWGEVSRRAGAEAMGRYGQQSGESVRALLPFFRNRAWAQVIAAEGAPQTLRTWRTVADIEMKPAEGGYDGFFRLKPFHLRYPTFDGGMSEELRRECFVAYDVSLVLPYDPVTDCVLLVEQLRFGPIHRGDPVPWVLEVVAGMVDAGETPEEAALRETREEARLDLTRLIRVSGGYASPGYSTEFYHNFIGLCELSESAARFSGGLDEEHEDIRNHVLRFDDAMRLIETGEINAVPLQMLLFALMARRPELRADA
ncbi:NUDIX domain-containing protein [Sagittula sp. MA-2]|jgi:nudix-type nucleoside diphosphatase (YffH/AdpP family)|uniref:NUDIX domain-containing protein n=1 Tax=Sagittula sp. MA-2 TaxID=3048007 RepID=UPI0024C35AAB|nr:NUDIX domain-containing protein [Sagittula sp. MA-2]WHZ37138.1 gamma-glutamylcyclotransferase [Sagittula sp. MA-2]